MVPHGAPRAVCASRAKWGGVVTGLVALALTLGVLGSKGMLDYGNREASGRHPHNKAVTPEPMASAMPVQAAGIDSGAVEEDADPSDELSLSLNNVTQDVTGLLGDPDHTSLPGIANSTVLLPSGGADQVIQRGDTCYVANDKQLQHAVENATCSSVYLTSTKTGAYTLKQEIVVRRRVSVSGSPLTMPVVDAEDAPRAFRVVAGGFLEAKYMVLIPSEADAMFARRRLPAEAHMNDTAGSDNNVVIRGGCVLFESGSLGGLFVGVYFVDDPEPGPALETAIRYTLEQTRVRVYGGFVLVEDGDVDFVGCLFWDLGILLPITNYIYVGGQILVLRGAITLTGCTFVEVNMFGVEFGLGLNVAVLGGTLVMSFSNYVEVDFAVTFMNVGDFILVAGGVAIYTGIDFSEFSALIQMVMAGAFTVLGGVQIFTGMANFEAIGIGAMYGVGGEYAVGMGLTVHVGSTVTENNGVYYQASLGEVSFIGAGEYVSIGTPFIEFTAIISEQGMGGAVFLGSGQATFVGAFVFDICAISQWYGLGALMSVGSGVMVWTGGAFIEATTMEINKGLGGEVFVGAGALVLYNSASIEWYTYLVTTHIDYWISGGCDPKEGELPVFIDGSFGCDNYELLKTRLGGRMLSNETVQPATPSEGVGLLMYNVTRSINPKLHTLDAHTSLLPTEVREMVEKYVEAIQQQQLGGDATATTDKHRKHKQKKQKLAYKEAPMVHVQQPLTGTCDIHLPDNMVEGPGKESCNIHPPDEMHADTHTPLLQSALQPLLSSSGSPGAIEHEPNILVMCALEATTRGGAPLTVEVLQEAASNATKQWQQTAGLVNATIRAQVYSASPSLHGDMLADLDMPWLHEIYRRGQMDDSGTTYHSYKMTIAATSEEVARRVVDAVEQGEEDDRSLATILKAQLAEHAGIELETVSLTYEKTLVGPAYRSMGMINTHKVRHLGANTVLLYDPEQSAVPVTEVEYDREYVLHIENFPPKQEVKVHLQPMQATRARKAVADTAFVEVITDDGGAAQVTHVFRKQQTAPADYFLEARASPSPTAADGGQAESFGYSPVYTLLRGRRTRKLYGTSMYA